MTLAEQTMNLLLLGSCRIHYTLGSVIADCAHEVLNEIDPMWFMHNVRAAEQSLRIIMGEEKPPLHLKELIFETDDTRDIKYVAPDVVKNADLLVVEMCTLKSLRLEGWEINSHRIYREESRTGQKIEGVEERYFTAHEIAGHIRKIKDATLKPVMIVNHISTTGISSMDTARRRVTDFTLAAQKMVDFEFFDTASVLNHVPLEQVLEDHSHYRDEFTPVMGHALADHITRCFS
ncbi:hypothetical protein [Pseudophaeobacter arcticus]|uniref:hypothetical protein n=1 Tax=Pseudophaeobacter arcticus TaxID=385492 RepID=UPI003A9764DF